MKNIRKLTIAVCLLSLVLCLLSGCGEESSKQAKEKPERLVHVMVSGIQDGDSAIATLTNSKTGKSLEAKYQSEAKAFCFLIRENGVYTVNVSADGKKTPETLVVVNDTSSYYFIYHSLKS